MTSCWRARPAERPSFSEVRQRLEALLAAGSDYLDLDNIDLPPPAPHLDGHSPPASPRIVPSTAPLLGEMQPPREGREGEGVGRGSSELDFLSLHIDMP